MLGARCLVFSESLVAWGCQILIHDGYLTRGQLCCKTILAN